MSKKCIVQQHAKGRREFMGLVGSSFALTLLPSAAGARPRPDAKTATRPALQIHREITPENDLVRAWYRDGDKTVSVSIASKHVADSHQLEFTYRVNDDVVLRQMAEHNSSRRQKTVGIARITTTGRGVEHAVMVDGSALSLRDVFVNHKGRAKVVVTGGGKTWESEYDFHGWTLLDASKAPHQHIPADLATLIEPLVPEIKARTERIRRKRGAPPLEMGRIHIPTMSLDPATCVAICSAAWEGAFAACIAGFGEFAIGFFICGPIADAAYVECFAECSDEPLN